MAVSAFELLDAPTQLEVTRALERCHFRHCTSTPESIALDILKSRARQDARRNAAKPTRTDNG
jgi:hypothetical protein